MGNFATACVCSLFLGLGSATAARAAEPLPKSLEYTFLVRGERVGQAVVRIETTPNTLRFASTVKVGDAENEIRLETKTEADPATYAIRSFSYSGFKGGVPVGSFVTVHKDSVTGTVTNRGKTTPKRRRVVPTPIAVWEDWVPEIEILLALQQAREFQNPMTRGMVLAASYTPAKMTLGFTGEVAVESETRSMAARKLVVSIEGGEPFESFVDPKTGVPVYIRFPGIGAEVFLNEFFGENPTTRYTIRSSAPTGR